MQTIPDAVLDNLLQHRPHLQQMIANLRRHPERAPQIEKALATAYLLGETHLSGQDTWHLAQVAYGGPWGGDWISTGHAAELLGYKDDSTLRRIAARLELEGKALKRGKRWFLRRDAIKE